MNQTLNNFTQTILS